MIATVTPALASLNQPSNAGISETSDTLVTDIAIPEVAASPVRSNATDGGLRRAPVVVIAPSDPVLGAPIGDSPEWTVGLGRYIYVYLNRGDWFWLAGLPRIVATTVICGWLTPTVGPAIACAMAIYIAATPLVAWTAPPSGYCKEIKFWYNGLFAGGKNVKRSC